MKGINNEKWLKDLIQSVMKAVEIEIEVRQENTGVNMSYNFIQNFVGFDAKRIQKARTELQSPLSLELYIKIFTLHELGHAVDQKALLDSLPRTIEILQMKRSYTRNEHYNNTDLLAILIEEHEMNIAFEETAWTNAENLNKQ
ncbi:integrase, partial [bacterium LRH843]|nr:integrase [bacterium LRH843]